MRLDNGSQLGNYQIMKFLGAGGFADVYLGKHIYLETMAAVKVIRVNSEWTDKEQLHFLAEARTVAQLHHHHIVKVLDFGAEGDLLYFVMEYAPHGSLRSRYPLGSVLPLPTILSYVQQVASALQYAHEHRVVHCDVKPENMLIGADDNILLGDFGIARVMQNTMQTQDVVGTAYYMAPEQFNGKPVPASDQYALGVVVYQWLCGQLPFKGKNAAHVLYMHTHMPPPSLSERVPALPPEVEKVVMRALMKQESQRFPNVQAFADAFEDAVNAGKRTSFFALPAQSTLASPMFAQEDDETEAVSVFDEPVPGNVDEGGTHMQLDESENREVVIPLPPSVFGAVPSDESPPVPADVQESNDSQQQELWDMPTVAVDGEDETVLQSAQAAPAGIPLPPPFLMPSPANGAADIQEPMIPANDASWFPPDASVFPALSLSIPLPPAISTVVTGQLSGNSPFPPIQPSQPIKIFISYSHRDREYRKTLDIFLAPLKSRATVWYDGEIQPGTDFDEEIEMRLYEAHIILLMVSPEFIASRYCREKEISLAMERHRAGTARVIPIIVRPALWRIDEIPFGRLQALPRDGKPITTWKNMDEAFLEVTKGVKKAIEFMARRV